MTIFYFVVATFPIALYFLALACVYGRTTPLVVGGRRDFFALCLALSGVFFIGPGQLLATWGASVVWGKYVWILIASFYLFGATFASYFVRPRLIVYNVGWEALRKTLTTTAIELDDDSRWSGAALNMPGLGAQFYVESGLGRVATIARIGSFASVDGWNRFSRALAAALRVGEKSKGRKERALFLIVGFALFVADSYCVLHFRDAFQDAANFYLSF